MLLIHTPASAQTFTWKSVNIQGTGYVTGLVIHPNTAIAPNTVYARTDVGGAYRFDTANNRWIPITDLLNAPGIESIAIDPAVANTVYAAFNNDVFKSTDRGATWTSTGLTGVGMGPNEYYRGTTGERLMVDPQKSGLLYFASRYNGVWKKDNAGPWTQVAGGLPTATDPAHTFVVFDKSSGLHNGATKTLYIGVWGSGVWRSTDAGATWSNIGGATRPCKAVVSPTGVLYVVYGQNEDRTEGNFGSVAKYSGGTWTTITPPSGNLPYTGISMDPTNANIIVVQTLDEIISRTTNGGTSWTQITWDYTGQPGYIGPRGGGGYGSGVVIDPNNVNNVWHTNGYAVLRTSNITANPALFDWVMKDFEEIPVQVVRTPPLVGGADLLSGGADQVGFRHASRDLTPTAVIGHGVYTANGTSMDYCYTQPQYVAYVGWDQVYWDQALSGYSSNNGQSWTNFGSTAPGTGGCIAMSATNPQNMVWQPYNMDAKYTTNGGATWNDCAGIIKSWQASVCRWCNPKIVVADRVNGNKFYFFDNGTFYYSNDGGATWTAGANNLWGWSVNTNIAVNPTTSGDLWICFPPGADQSPMPAYRSTDGGLTFNAVTTMDSARFIAFGKGSSATNPDVYMVGRVGGSTTDNVYRSTDMGASWVLISNPSQHNFGMSTCLEGDMRTANIVYVGTSGRGIIYGQATAPSVPSTPTGLTATPGDAQISLAWTASTGATSYNVKRSTTSGSGYSTIASPTATSYTNTGLTNGTTYYYVVSAVNSAGESGNSSQASATPTAPAPQAQIASGTATIDGTVEAAWNNATSYSLTKTTGTVASTADCSGSYKVMWDATNLYVLIDVTDDVKINDSTNVYEDDSVEVYVDGGNNKTTTYDTNDRQYQYGHGDTVVVEGGGRTTTGVTFARVDPTTTSYRIETNIPWATLGVTAAANNLIGIDVHVNDDDDSASRDGKKIWNDGTDMAWSNPSLFGTGKLNATATIPAAPTGLTATAGNAQVTLSWTASSGATSYTVKRSTTSGSGYASVATGITTTSYTNTGLTNGTTYYYVVSAVNSVGESANSSQASATPTGTTPGGTGTISREVWTSVTGTSVSQIPLSTTPSSTGTLTSFEAPTNIGDNYGQRVRGYLTAPQTGSYTFWIASDDDSELWLGTSDQASSKAKIASVTGWTNSREWGKFASQKSASISLTAGTRYYVEALQKEGNGGDNLAVGWARPGQSTTAPSEVIPGAQLSPWDGGTAQPPAAPTGLTATAGNGQVALSWTASTGATSYNVKRSTTSGSGYSTITSPTTTSYTNTGLTNGTTYYYVASAVNSAGESANSSQASATPTAGSGTAAIAAGTATVDTTVESAWSNATAYTINNITGTISSTSDCSGNFKGMWDSTNLYVLVNVTDDDKRNDSTDPWQDDSVEVYIDGNNDKSTSYDSNDRQYIFGWNDTAVVEPGGRSSTGVTFAKADPSTTSYRMEAKVPWSTLGVTASGGKNIGLDVHINDDDAGGSREGKRQWNDAADTAWQNPSVFGTATLQSGGSPPAAPTGLAATAGDGQVALSWTGSSGATSYNVKRSTTSGSGYSTIASPTTTSYTNTGLTNGTTYYYVVSATNSAGTSANSSQVSATPAAVSGNTRTGTWACKGVLSGTVTNTNVYQTFNVASNTDYVASLWIKGTGSVNIHLAHGSWGAGIPGVRCDASGTWQKFTTPVFNTGSSTQITIWVQDDYTTAGTVYIDDIFVGVSGGTNVLPNPSFESGAVNWGTGSAFSIVQNP